ncbi:MAG: hypothetical protein DI640_14730 [Sphingomonas taxi]|uniref:DUF6950 domain-containing protein n=1 Tax=Sphingomonas taxi TaxID=1549858 RepID=A0A2W4YMF9_9SPHN|nr:MAG: hypothetical protein DI640_14730 [Sphingomonas taxi]
MNLVDRRDVTQATMRHFAAKPFDWAKAATCAHMVRQHVAAMGHKVPPMTRFGSALTAREVLRSRGWDNLAAMMDATLPAILPVEAIIGDVVELPSDSDAFGALCIAVGNGRVMGYFEGQEGLSVMQPLSSPVAAWRA